MKDPYTRVILMVIAIGLFWIADNGTINAEAGPDIVDVNIVNERGGCVSNGVGGQNQVGWGYSKRLSRRFRAV